MFFKEWEVLLVDDEPDVLSISKLAMRDFEVYGLPLNLRMATSMAEALEHFKGAPQLAPTISVAFVDVVMETDSAGLDLCKAVREDMHNHLTQLFIRTGQPGVAPERQVIDRYDINGYFTKVEATEDKLYSLVKSGVRQYFSGWFSIAMTSLSDSMIAAGNSRAALAESVQRVFQGVSMVGETVAGPQNVQGCVLIEDRLVAGIGFDEADALVVRDRLARLDGIPLGHEGDKAVVDGQNNQLLNVAGGLNRADAQIVIKGNFAPPENVLALNYMFLRSLATLWKRAT